MPLRGRGASHRRRRSILEARRSRQRSILGVRAIRGASGGKGKFIMDNTTLLQDTTTQCYERERIHGLAGDLRGRVVRGIRFSASAAHLAIRQRQSEGAVFAFQLFTSLSQPRTRRLEVFVRREMRLDHSAGLVLCDCAFQFFYSSFQSGDLVGFGLGRHV